MALTMRELVTKWGFDIDMKALKEMNANIFFLKENLESAYHGAKEIFDVTFGLAERQGEYAKETEELANRFQISTTRLQEYQAAARKAHIGTQQFTMGLQHLVDNAFNVAYKGNKEMAAMFAYLHVNVRKNNGEMKNAEELLLDVSEGLKKYVPANERSAFVTQLFGVRLGALTNAVASGRQFWLDAIKNSQSFYITNEKGIQTLSKFDDRVQDMRTMLNGLKNQVAIELVPILSKLMSEFTRFVNSDEFNKFIHDDLPVLINGLGDLAKVLATLGFGTLKEIANPIKTLNDQNAMQREINRRKKENEGHPVPVGELLSRRVTELKVLLGVGTTPPKALTPVPTGGSVNNHFHTTVSVNGAQDPHATATAVAQKVDEAHKQKQREANRARGQGSI